MKLLCYIFWIAGVLADSVVIPLLIAGTCSFGFSLEYKITWIIFDLVIWSLYSLLIYFSAKGIERFHARNPLLALGISLLPLAFSPFSLIRLSVLL